MRLPVMGAVFTANATLLMAAPSEWAIWNLADGLEALNTTPSEATYFVGGMSIRGLAMSPSVSAVVSTLTGYTPNEHNARLIEKRLERCPVEKMIDALATPSVDKRRFWRSSVPDLIDSVMNVSSCSTEKPESKRSTCGLGLPSCVEACDGGFWFKPVPGACHLVCTIAEEHCTRCQNKREADTRWSRSAQDSGDKPSPAGPVQAASDVDLSQLLWLYALSMLMAIAGFVYQARQMSRISDQVDAKLAEIKDSIRGLVAEALMDKMEQVRREHNGHGTGAGKKSSRDLSFGTGGGKEDFRDGNGARAKGDREDSGTTDVEDAVGGDGGNDGGAVGQPAEGGGGAPEQESAGLVDATFAFAYGWAKDRVGI